MSPIAGTQRCLSAYLSTFNTAQVASHLIVFAFAPDLCFFKAPRAVVFLLTLLASSQSEVSLGILVALQGTAVFF